MGRRGKFYQFTAIDDCTRLRVLRIYPKPDQKTAIQFVDYVLAKLPFTVDSIQTDNVVEFASSFHWHVLDKGIQHVYIKPRTPRLNGKIERSHRIDAEELYHPLEGEVIDDAKVWGSIFLAAGIGIPLQLGYFMILTYVPTYLKINLHYDAATSFFASGASLMVDMLVIPFAALLADRWGRKPGMLLATIGFIAGSVPLFMLIENACIGAFVALAALGLLHGVYLGFSAAALAEVFTTRNRYGGLSVGHNLGSVVFGGSMPFLAAFLTGVTGNNLVPAFLILGACLLALCAITIMKDQAGQPQRPQPGQRRRVRPR